MKERITVSGFVATQPEQTIANDALVISSFRIGTTERVRDRETGEWRDGHTNWFTVKAFRELARNVLACVHQGEPVVVTGHLKVKKWRREDGTNTTFVELEADSIGHDLAWGSTKFARTRFARQARTDGQDAAEDTAEEVLDTETGELTSGDTRAGSGHDVPWAEEGDLDPADAVDQEAA